MKTYMLKNVVLSSILILLTISLYSQELNFTVSVNAPQLNTTDPNVIRTMEQEIQEFLNTTKWTEDEYEPEERIEGNLAITITTELGANSFNADFNIQSIRPIFNSTEKTTLLNYVDKGVNFGYIENQPIRRSDVKYYDNLSTILSFYAYVVIGLDYDSFEKLGGQDYFTLANNMIQSLPSNVQTTAGWSASGGSKKRSRYWMIENFLNPRLKGMRESMYTYHRKGLDVMHEEVAKGKAVVLSSLKSVKTSHDLYPNAMYIQMFSDSKNEEIIEIFLAADRNEKVQVYDLLVDFDPYRAGKYNVLKR